jgi:hypothetical protein
MQKHVSLAVRAQFSHCSINPMPRKRLGSHRKITDVTDGFSAKNAKKLKNGRAGRVKRHIDFNAGARTHACGTDVAKYPSGESVETLKVGIGISWRPEPDS